MYIMVLESTLPTLDHSIKDTGKMGKLMAEEPVLISSGTDMKASLCWIKDMGMEYNYMKMERDTRVIS